MPFRIAEPGIQCSFHHCLLLLQKTENYKRLKANIVKSYRFDILVSSLLLLYRQLNRLLFINLFWMTSRILIKLQFGFVYAQSVLMFCTLIWQKSRLIDSRAASPMRLHLLFSLRTIEIAQERWIRHVCEKHKKKGIILGELTQFLFKVNNTRQ